MTIPTPDQLCERLLTLAADCEIGESNYCVELADAAKEAGTTLRDLIQQQQATIERLSAALSVAEGLCNQVRTDLMSAHVEICKLQGLDPDKYDWPEWSSPANTLRWLESTVEPQIRAALGKDASDE